ncbi:MAG: nuclear transport factor 2 family protein [Calditrichaeota bacterium]|nr:nuclear transport factor 2 family protein [Calditrichota bacterium]
MKTKNLLITAVICLISIMGCNQKENQMDKKMVEERLSTYFAALNSADVETIVSGYAQNGVFMAPDFPAFSGTEQIREAYKTIFGQIQLKVNVKIHEITVAGEFAFAYTESEGTVTVKANNAVVPEKNKELFVLVKSGEGWLIRQYAFNKIAPAK